LLVASSIFFAYFKISFLDSFYTKNIDLVLERAKVYNTLKDCIGHIIFNEQDKEEEAQFYLQDNVLYFTFNNGIDKDPRFSSKVEAKLFINDIKELILEIKPSKHRFSQSTAIRQNLLMTNVSSIAFEFFLPSPKDHLEVNPNEIRSGNAPYGYSQKWNKEFKLLPHSFTLEVLKDVKEEKILSSYPFLLCNL
jgi:hypothetical protein